jgi:hypothetical protein
MGCEQYKGRMIPPQMLGKELGVSEFTIHRWIREGKIKAVKLSSRCTRVVGDSMASFLNENAFVPGTKEEQPENLKKHNRKKGSKSSTAELAGQA